MSPLPRALGARLSALHASCFLGLGFYLPFFPVWLQSKALGPSVIGIIVAIPIMVRILVTAPLLALADGPLGPRRLLLASYAGQLVGYPILLMLDSDVAIAGMVAVLAVFQAAVIPANDLVTTIAVRRGPGLHYGRIRGFGSIAFLFASVAAGYLIDSLGAGIVIWALAVAPLLGLLATHLAVPPNIRPDLPPPAAPASGTILPRALWLLIAAAALIQGSHGGLYAFGSIEWRAVGFSDSVIGYFWAIGVVAEILVFYLLGRGVGRGSAGLGLILLGGAAAAFRWALLAASPGLWATLALQALHGLSFGATHLGSMAALAALAPDKARGRAQGLLGSSIALAMAAATVLSGFLYRISGTTLFAAMAPLGAAAVALVLLAMRDLRNHPQRAGEGG